MPRLPLTLAFFKLETIDEGRRCAWGMSFPIASPTSFLPSSGQGRLKWTPFLWTRGKRHAFDAGVRSDAESADERPERLLRQEQLDGETGHTNDNPGTDH